uniref:Elongin A, like n=1 Tax=Cyprinodon variegatus TaxID=28743 RepID=A0A3Q2DCX7_CYPVA
MFQETLFNIIQVVLTLRLVLKILQKLKDLDITLDILSETGIGKTVNSLRRHKQAGELAKSLVKVWKKLVSKESASQGDEAAWLGYDSYKNKEGDRSCSGDGSWLNDENNNSPTSNNEALDDQARKVPIKKEQMEEQRRKANVDKNNKKHQEIKTNITKSNSKSKAEIQEDGMGDSVVCKLKKQNGDTMLGGKSYEGTPKKHRSESRQKLKGEKESCTKAKPSKESSVKEKEPFPSCNKHLKTLKGAKDCRLLEMSSSSEAQNRKRKKANDEKHGDPQYKSDPESKKYSKSIKIQIRHRDAESNSEQEEPSMSFESYLNYDVNVHKKREHSGQKRTSKITRTASKEQTPKDTGIKRLKSSSLPEQVDRADIFKTMTVVDIFFIEVEKEPDFCEEESAVFTGQRLNKKMQVYSGAKTLFLPTMMSLYQQCIRTLQNNLNLLYETGGVPFELLEPVLERCTPEQLLRIEEFNPVRRLTDHLWGKHCQRDFKDCKLQEYESWKEMYIRLSEERERKLKKLTKTIVSAHSKKPKGRQVKMAFIHTVAKPPRDVRIQQEIHGTAVQQPHQPKCRYSRCHVHTGI